MVFSVVGFENVLRGKCQLTEQMIVVYEMIESMHRKIQAYVEPFRQIIKEIDPVGCDRRMEYK